jgi:hypothetical protein
MFFRSIKYSTKGVYRFWKVPLVGIEVIIHPPLFTYSGENKEIREILVYFLLRAFIVFEKCP